MMQQRISQKISSFKKKELDLIFKQAKPCFKSQAFTILSAPAELDYGKILVITSRKYGNSPERNLIRRRFKAIFWEEKLYEEKQNIIIICRKPGQQLSFTELKNILLSCFK